MPPTTRVVDTSPVYPCSGELPHCQSSVKARQGHRWVLERRTGLEGRTELVLAIIVSNEGLAKPRQGQMTERQLATDYTSRCRLPQSWAPSQRPNDHAWPFNWFFSARREAHRQCVLLPCPVRPSGGVTPSR